MERIKISQLCRIVGGKPNPKEDIAFDKIGVPFVKMRDLGRFHHTTNLNVVEFFLNETFAEKNGYKIIKKGAILLPRSGSVSVNHRAILGMDASIVSHICALEVIDTNIIDNFYLYYYLTMLDMGRIAQKTTGLDSVTFKRIGEIKIPVLPRIEQSKIVAQLNKIQELINKRTQTLGLLDDYIKSIFFEMFGDPIIDNHRIGKKPLSYFGQWKSGGTPLRSQPQYFEGNIPWYTSGELNSIFIKDSKEKITDEALKKASTQRIKKGSLLIGMYDTAALKSSITLEDASCNQAIAFSALNENICEPIFIYYNIILAKDYYLNQRKGARQKNLSLTKIKNIKVLFPNMDLQKSFVKTFNTVESLKEKQIASLHFLDILFQSTLQSGFNEEIQIDEDEIFEDILGNLDLKEFKKGKRLQYLVNWLNKKEQRFSNFKNYDDALKKVLDILDSESIEQVLVNNEIKLKVII